MAFSRAFFSSRAITGPHVSRFLEAHPSPSPSVFPLDFAFRVLSSHSRVLSRTLSSAAAEEIDLSDDIIETESVNLRDDAESKVASFKKAPKTAKFSRRKKIKELEKRSSLRLDELIKEAVGLKAGEGASLSEEEVLEGEPHCKEIKELQRRLRNLETEVKLLRENAIVKESVKPLKKEKKDGVALSSLFTYHPNAAGKNSAVSEGHNIRKFEETKLTREVSCGSNEPSPEMVLFVNQLSEKGYLTNKNILQEGRLNPHRAYLLSAAQRFGLEHQEIAKWLSGSDMKKVALFGCPTLEKKTVDAAKSLRSFFNIQEDVVCRGCKLKTSCKFANEKGTKTVKLVLSDALRVLTLYGLGSVSHELSISDEVNGSTRKLLKDVVNLSK